MSPRSWKMLPALVVLALPFTAWGQGYNAKLASMVNGPWHHVPSAVGQLQFNKDQARCRVVAAQTPVNSATPAVVERLRWTVLVNCLKASGYEPGPAPAKNTLPSDSTTKAAALLFYDYSCAEIAQIQKTSPAGDSLLFTWARGFIRGWNASAKDPIMEVDPAALPPDEQLKFIQTFCTANPSKLYLDGVLELMAKLQYETSRRGKVSRTEVEE